MAFGAFLKTVIYLVSSSLLYPVLFLLVALLVWLILYSGTFFAEWLERMRLDGRSPERLPEKIKAGQIEGTLSHRVQKYISRLKNVLSSSEVSEEKIENLLQDTTLNTWKSLDRLRIFVRVAPGLGLIGTLIPMGTGLAALGQGDMSKLTSDLVIAFTTTVVGLALGLLAFFFYTYKRRWLEEDIKNIELATEVLSNAAASASTEEQRPEENKVQNESNSSAWARAVNY
jgi:biopolymer transport protein ExbB/TolQ